MINSIRLQKFRSYADESFEFDKGVNIVVGPNGSGKTNLLEAILLLASGKSYRVRDLDLIKFSAPWTRLDGYFGASHRVLKIVRGEERADKSYEIDDKPYKRLNLERTEPVVLFEPNNMQLFIRGPEYRRNYFDDILERTQPGFKSLSNAYRRTVAQRNALLKQPQGRANKQLFAWNIRLSELGAQVVKARVELVADINKTLSKSYNKIAGGRVRVDLRYESPFDLGNYSSKLLHKLESASSHDFDRGFTAYGPHREDFLLYISKKPASLTASRGETRSLILALKIYELKLVEKVRGQKPIFLLDDVFSELDGARRKHLVDSLKDQQTIITTTDADSVVQYFSEDSKLIPLQ